MSSRYMPAPQQSYMVYKPVERKNPEIAAVAGYSGFLPAVKTSMFGKTYGQTATESLTRDRWQYTGNEVAFGYNPYTVTRQVSTHRQTLPGAGFYGRTSVPVTGKLRQGSAVNLQRVYDNVEAEIRRKAKTTSPSRNYCSVKFGDPFYFTGQHMYETTYRESFAGEPQPPSDDEKESPDNDDDTRERLPKISAPTIASFSSSVAPTNREIDPSAMSLEQGERLKTYREMENSVGFCRLYRLETRLRDLLYGRERSKTLLKLCQQYDPKHTGLISSKDLMMALDEFGVTVRFPEAIALCGKFDSDLSGCVDYHALVAAYVPAHDKTTRSHTSLF